MSLIPSLQVLDFSKGQQNLFNDYLTPNNQVRLALNVDFKEVGNIKKRLGYAAIGSQIVNDKSILGLYRFISSTANRSQTLAVCNDATNTNSDIFYNSSGTWTKTKENWTQGLKVRFTTFLNYVFATNGTDAVATWDGNPAGAWGTTNAVDAPTGKYIAEYFARVYIAGNTTNPDTVYYSALPSAGSISWTSGNGSFDVSPNDGQNITGLENNGVHLLIFKERGLYRWRWGQVDAYPIIDIGTTSQESVKTIHGSTYFFNQYGVYVYSGGFPELISRPIQAWIEAISVANYSSISAGVDEENYYCSVGDLSIDGVSYSNVVLIYNFKDKNWRVYSYAEEMKVFTEYSDSTTRSLIAGNDDGDVVTINSGNADGSVAITSAVETKWYSFASRGEIKKIDKIIVYSKTPSTATFQYKVRDGEWSGAETLNKTIQIFKDWNIQGQAIKFRIASRDNFKPWEFEGFELVNIFEGESENYGI